MSKWIKIIFWFGVFQRLFNITKSFKWWIYIYFYYIYIIRNFSMFFHIYKFTITKIIINLVFGQILMFSFEIIFVENSSALKGNLYILILIIGFLVGCFIRFLSYIYDKLYYLYYYLLLDLSMELLFLICVL